MSFSKQVKALKYRRVKILLKSYDTKWVSITQEIICKVGRWSKEFKSWSAPDFLLLSPSGKFEAKNLKGVQAGWSKPKGLIPLVGNSMSLFKLLHLQFWSEIIPSKELKDFMIWIGSRGINKTSDLPNPQDGWKSLDELRGNRWSYHKVGKSFVENLRTFVSRFNRQHLWGRTCRLIQVGLGFP